MCGVMRCCLWLQIRLILQEGWLGLYINVWQGEVRFVVTNKIYPTSRLSWSFYKCVARLGAVHDCTGFVNVYS